MTDDKGQKLEFKYISRVFEEGRDGCEVSALIKQLAILLNKIDAAKEKHRLSKLAREAARDEVNKHYGKEVVL
jgi:hypothetical protein